MSGPTNHPESFYIWDDLTALTKFAVVVHCHIVEN